MADGFIEADTFALAGAGADITYDLASTKFSYSGPTRPPQRDHVEVTEAAAPLETPIGRLVTAVLRADPDGDTSTISVLLPRVNLSYTEGGGAVGAGFEAVAVWTTTRSSFGGPKLVEGPVQLYTPEPMSGTASRAAPATPCWFTAVLTRELPGPGTLVVEGECTLPSTGYEVALVRQEPPGINPKDLLLRLVVTPPSEVVLPVVTTYPVRYQEETQVYLDTVTILPDGMTVEVQIIT